MALVMKLDALMGEADRRNPVVQRLLAHEGRYLSAYDHRTPAGEEPSISTVADPAKAMRFDSAVEAWGLWRRAYGIRPWDGKPNCPLTAFTITLEPVE